LRKGKTRIKLAKLEIIVYLPSDEYTGHVDLRIGFKKGIPHEKTTIMDMKQIIKAEVKEIK